MAAARDKLVGLVIVVAVAGLIAYVGGKLRAPRAPAVDAATEVHAIGDAATVTDGAAPTDASVAEDADDAEDDATLAMSAACRALAAATRAKYDAARDAGYCIDSSVDDLACKTSSNGATWGLRADDVTDLEVDAAACPTGWLVRVVHVAADGTEQTLVPPGPGGVRNGHRYNVYRAAPVEIDEFFDFDGDGEDEIVVSRWTSTFLYAFKRGRIVPYPPAAGLDIGAVKDVDGDGRPDLLVRPFGDDPPTTVELLAHALPDGTFTFHDALAVKHAQALCPSDAPVTRNATDEELANGIACARLWGHDASALGKALCEGDAGKCPPWVRPMLWTKPPLSLR